MATLPLRYATTPCRIRSGEAFSPWAQTTSPGPRVTSAEFSFSVLSFVMFLYRTDPHKKAGRIRNASRRASRPDYLLCLLRAGTAVLLGFAWGRSAGRGLPHCGSARSAHDHLTDITLYPRLCSRVRKSYAFSRSQIVLSRPRAMALPKSR